MKYPRPLEDEMVLRATQADKIFEQAADAMAWMHIVLESWSAAHAVTRAHTIAGFQGYLRAHKIRNFTAKELCTPNDARKAARVGYRWLLPPLWLWPRAVLVVYIAQLCRTAVGASVSARNLWRPMSYNRLVAKSAIESDHPNCSGIDLDFQKVAHRRKAEGVVRGLHAAMDVLEISVGLGFKTMHVGCQSPEGSRYWFYSSFPKGEARVAL